MGVTVPTSVCLMGGSCFWSVLSMCSLDILVLGVWMEPLLS